MPFSRCDVVLPRRAVQRFLPIVIFLSALLAGCQSLAPTGAADAKTVGSTTTAPAPVPPIATTPGTDTSRDARRVPALPKDLAPTDPSACCLRANLWDRIRAGFRFDLAADNPRIAAQRDWYIRNQDYLDRVVARASRYLQHIVEQTEARDMPTELALLPVVESAFDPFAYSVADAAGPWQFIPSTGRIYGLRQDWWFDGRRDILLSTDAALTYLERLAASFDGDYYKALASYNAGAGTISRAVTRNLRAGRPTDYWNLNVPQETAAYVPKLIALAQIVQDPAKYGVRLNPIADEPRFAVVSVPGQIDLARAAELADMPLTELYMYNPAYSRWATAPQGPYQLLVPVECAEAFRTALTGVTSNADRVQWDDHVVAEGETVDSISAIYGISAEAIRIVNGIDDTLPAVGTHIGIPKPHLMIANADLTYESRVALLNLPSKPRKARSPESSTKRYVVRRGDTLSKVARKHGVAAADLARWNHLRRSKALKVGQVLVIQRGDVIAKITGRKGKTAKSDSGGGDRRVRHKVKRGETLFSLARKYKVSVHDIARWNDFNARHQLQVGESVKLYTD